MRLTVTGAGAALALAFTFALPGTSAAVAQAAEGPRFITQPVEGGLMKLDTRSGAMSFCSTKSGAWVCEAVPEDRAALEAEIGRLQARIAVLERGRPGAGVPDIMAPPESAPPESPPPESPPPGTPPAAQAPDDATPPADDPGLSKEADKRLDQAMDMAEHVFRRFFEMVDRLRRDAPPAQDQSL